MDGADDTRIAASNFVEGMILSVNVFIATVSELREDCKDNEVFRVLGGRISDRFEGWLEDPTRRLVAAKRLLTPWKSQEAWRKQRLWRGVQKQRA